MFCTGHSESFELIRGLFNVAEPGMNPTANDVKHFAKTNLSSYKCPRKIAFVEKLPLNAGDKLDRHPSVLKNYTLTTLHYKH